MFAGPRLRVLLSLLFDMFIRYSFVPHPFCESVILPLMKCKTATLSYVDNCTAISLSNTISNTLQHITTLWNEDEVDRFQFGF